MSTVITSFLKPVHCVGNPGDALSFCCQAAARGNFTIASQVRTHFEFLLYLGRCSIDDVYRNAGTCSHGQMDTK